MNIRFTEAYGGAVTDRFVMQEGTLVGVDFFDSEEDVAYLVETIKVAEYADAQPEKVVEPVVETPDNIVDSSPVEEADSSPDESLPEDFPAREKLIEAGYTTLDSLADITADTLEEISGIGPATANDILEALA